MKLARWRFAILEGLTHAESTHARGLGLTGPGGCGYDALNVSADGTGGFVGSNVDPNGVFDNFGNAYFYCNGTGNGSGGLQLDTPCWTDYHPEIDVTAEKS
jgi:hypothetical protein